MRREGCHGLAAVIVLALALGGCAQFRAFEQKVENAYSALNGAQVNYTYVAAGIASFQGLQRLGEAYLRLPTCTATSGPVCHDKRATKPLRAAFLTGRKGRDDAIAYMDAHPCTPEGVCPLMPSGVYAGLKAAIGEIQSLYETYKVNAGAQ